MKTIMLFFSILLVSISTSESYGQQMGFGAKGGLTVGIQRELQPLISYHGDLFFESLSKWQGENLDKQSRIGFVAQLGYHRKGASYTNGRNFGGTRPNQPIEDVFHNLSLSVLLKGNFQWGKLLPYYAAGIRGDVNLAADLYYESQPNFVLPQINRVTFGFWLGGGIEWEPPKSPIGVLLEINVSPDLTPQMIKTQRLIFNSSTGLYTAQFINPPERTINIALEISAGFKFIDRIEWEEEEVEEF